MFHVKPPSPPVVVIEGDLVVVHAPEPFLFSPGHRLRATHCLICHQMIGAQPATIIGVGALAGDPCTCSAVVSDMFLLHAHHLPMPPADLQAAIHRGLQCDNPDH